ncbi:MAG: HdeA/HdeB family chaperone [Methyloceanibacter sp.]|nr:HdeA/HdeB family chaperone [Methyloceanibacter sp.]
MIDRLKSIAVSGRSLAIALVLSVPLATVASAQVTVDVGKITCNQFALYKVSDPDTIAVWLHGYYSGKRGNTVVEVETLKANVRKLRDYCLQNPDTNLLKAVETLLSP